MLEEFVNEYFDINNKVKHINKGGCGIFAKHLYIKLKLMGYSPRLVIITNDIDDTKKLLNESIAFAGLYIHIMVKVNGKYLDCQGIYKTFNNTEYENFKVYGLFSFQRLNEMNDEPMWNPKFNRDNISVIEKKLEKAYKKVTKGLVLSN